MNERDSEKPTDKELWRTLKNRPEDRASPLFLITVVLVAAALAAGVYYFYKGGGLQI